MSGYALKKWARALIADNRVPMKATALRWDVRGVGQAILHREGQRQVEMIIFPPNLSIPAHRHNAVESFEVLVAGSLQFLVDGRSYEARAEQLGGGLAWQLLHVPAGVWHGGQAQEQGTIFLSFQHWHGRAPAHIGEDWESWTA